MKDIFRCDYCGYVTQDTDKIRTHEAKCEWNKANKTCFTCEYSGCDITHCRTCSIHVQIKDLFYINSILISRLNRRCDKWVEPFDYTQLYQ